MSVAINIFFLVFYFLFRGPPTRKVRRRQFLIFRFPKNLQSQSREQCVEMQASNTGYYVQQLPFSAALSTAFLQRGVSLLPCARGGAWEFGLTVTATF